MGQWLQSIRQRLKPASALRCRPGDLAIVVWPGAWHGRIVRVLYDAPLKERFTLPNGIEQPGNYGPGGWIVASTGTRFGHGIRGDGQYATAQDRYLVPLPRCVVGLVFAHKRNNHELPNDARSIIR